MDLRGRSRGLSRSAVALVAGALAAATLAASPAGAEDGGGDDTFADVAPDRYYAEAVGWARAAGVVGGYTPHCFGPEWTATRAEVVVMLHRALGEPVADTPHPFDDVTAAWQDAAVRWASTTGVTTGVAPDRFDPDGLATRAEVATFIWRAAGSPAAAPGPFVDVVRSWQLEPVGWMAATGITTGRSDTRFDPDAAVSRAELATFLWRWQDRPPAVVAEPGPPRNCEVEAGRCSDLFGTDLVAGWRATHPGVSMTAAVHDTRTGCRYHLDEGAVLTTASVIKAQVLAGVLLQAQADGRGLTPDEAAAVELMMHFSHNRPPTSELYVQVGGAAGMEALDAAFGIAGTSHTARYGATRSTAEDRTTLVRQLLVGGGPLDDESVATAWEWMSTVSDAQSWGISAGLPLEHEYALKNGFYPMAGRGWRLGSTGVVRDPEGGAYAVTIMTEHNVDEATGIALVETIARHVNERLTAGEPSPQRSAQVTCIEPPGGTSWEVAAATLGEIDAVRLRLLNGGEAAILSGQRVCRD